jgi:hypothetical protein
MTATLQVLFPRNAIETDDAEATTIKTKTSALVGDITFVDCRVTTHAIERPVARQIARVIAVTPHGGEWIATMTVQPQAIVARCYQDEPTWRPPPPVVSAAVSNVEEPIYADAAALAAMDAAEERLAAARNAEFERDREDRLYYRD